MEYQLDMSMMFAMHDALRRELVQVARIGRRTGDHPGQLLRAALGWELFKKFLLVHHQAEDDTLWPALRANVAGQPGRVALAYALEAEHAVIEPGLRLPAVRRHRRRARHQADRAPGPRGDRRAAAYRRFPDGAPVAALRPGPYRTDPR